VSIKQVLEADLARAEIDLPVESIAGLCAYGDELERWSRRVNLTALKGHDLARRLIVEPIRIGRELELSGVLADIGSGNGSPAIPLCLTRSFGTVHLIEARARRAAFLRHIVGVLGLTYVRVHKTRTESMDRLPDAVDWTTLQAVAPTPELLGDLRRIAGQSTKIVWITSQQSPPVPAEHLVLPDSETEAWIFRLDQS
jgi:16S rRNA (guanine527-N7)-methyltransferase